MIGATLVESDAVLTLQAGVIDRESGLEAPDQFFVVTLSSESGSSRHDVVSLDGLLTLTVPMPEAERSSISMTIRKDAHILGTAFLG